MSEIDAAPTIELPDGSGGTAYVRQRPDGELVIVYRKSTGHHDQMTLDPDLFLRIVDAVAELAE